MARHEHAHEILGFLVGCVACDDDFASCGTGTENRQIVYQQQNATFYGAEIIGQYDILPVGNGFAGIEAQFDFVRAQFDNGTNVPRIPPYRLGGGVYLRADGWFARVNLLHAFDHQATALFETPTPGYDDLRAELSYTKAVDPAVYGASAITLGVQGRNLLDADIRNSTMWLGYRPAARHLQLHLAVDTGIGRLPDPQTLTWTRLEKLADRALEDLAPYAKAIGPNRARAGTLEALALLDEIEAELGLRPTPVTCGNRSPCAGRVFFMIVALLPRRGSDYGHGPVWWLPVGTDGRS